MEEMNDTDKQGIRDLLQYRENISKTKEIEAGTRKPLFMFINPGYDAYTNTTGLSEQTMRNIAEQFRND